MKQPKFSRLYLKNFLTLYKLPDDFSELTSKMVEVKCRTKDQVDLVMNCIMTNGANVLGCPPTQIYRLFFERSRWVVPGKKNPFLD